MPKVFSPFQGQDPLGAVLSSLGKKMFGGDTSASALDQEKLYDAQRTNVERDNLARRIAEGGGMQKLGADPIAQAMAVLGGFKPDDIGGYGLMGAANQFGAADPRTQNWQVGTGGSYASTADAVRAAAAETARSNDMTSANQRYGVDQTRAQKMYEFGNVGADQAVDNTEVARNNNMASADRLYSDNLASKDRRYGVDVGADSSRYGVDQAQATERSKFFDLPVATVGPQGQPTFARQGELVGGPNAPLLSETDQKGTLLGNNFDNLPALDPNQQEVLGARIKPPEGAVLLPADVEAQKIRLAQAGAAKTIGTPPAGYRVVYDANNNPIGMEPIPGSPAEAEAAAAQRTLEAKNQNQQVVGGLVLEDIGRVKNIVENAPWYDPATGSAARLLANIPSTSAADASALTDTIKANIGFDRLQQMRDESPTGGALGQVSEMELNLLSSVLGSLSQSQSEQQFLYNLNRLGKVYQDVLRKAAAYPNASKFGFAGGSAGPAPQADGPAAAPTPGAIEDGHQFLGGDPADPANWRAVQ